MRTIYPAAGGCQGEAPPHLASVMDETSEPRECGRGSVQTKCRSMGLKARTVPSAQPQKIMSSDKDSDWATPVYDTGQDRGDAAVIRAYTCVIYRRGESVNATHSLIMKAFYYSF